MKPLRPLWFRLIRGLLIAVVAVELLYVVAGNLLLNSGLIPLMVRGAEPKVRLGWDRAYTWAPGYAGVDNFSLQLEGGDDVLLDLRVDHSTTNLKLLPLLERKLAFDGTRAHGVVYRMVTKMSEADWNASPERVAAFPKIEGLTWPPLKAAEPPPPASAEQIEGMLRVEMTDVIADVKEFWFDELHYAGGMHVKGAFGLHPLKSLWVGPAWVTLDGGKVLMGEHTVLPAFTAGIDFEIAPVEMMGKSPSVIASTLNVGLRTVTAVDDLGFVSLYIPGLDLQGKGLLSLNVHTVGGKVMPDTKLAVDFETVQGKVRGFSYDGALGVKGVVTEKLEVQVLVDTKGKLTTPVLEKRRLTFDQLVVMGEVITAHNDLQDGLGLNRVSGLVKEARATDAAPVTEAAGAYVPGIAQAILGNGPLTAVMGVTHTPEQTVLRLKSCKMGGAAVTGGMIYTKKTWSGAAYGQVGALPLGLLVTKGTLAYRPSTDGTWLPGELTKMGIVVEPPSQAAAAGAK